MKCSGANIQWNRFSLFVFCSTKNDDYQSRSAENSVFRKSICFCRPAAEKGDVIAQYKLRQAAEQGFAPAQYILGGVYQDEDGVGVAKDDAQAIFWYRKAAAQGYAEAQKSLDEMKAQ